MIARLSAFFALMATVAAFAPLTTRPMRSAASLKMGYENEVGALPPVGFFDPLGLSKDIDAPTFKNYREAELKHGRVAMLAIVGYIAQEFFRLPGVIDLDGTTFSSIPNGVAAIGVVPSFGWIQIFALIGFWELIGWEDRRASEEPGDFGTTLFGRRLQGDEKVTYQTKELQNGRLAMLAIMELITHDIAKPAGEGLFVLHHL